MAELLLSVYYEQIKCTILQGIDCICVMPRSFEKDLTKKIEAINPVNILNKGNVELSWDGRNLMVGESMKGQRILVVFSCKKIFLNNVGLSSPRGGKLLERARIKTVFYAKQKHDKATLPYRCPDAVVSRYRRP